MSYSDTGSTCNIGCREVGKVDKVGKADSVVEYFDWQKIWVHEGLGKFRPFRASDGTFQYPDKPSHPNLKLDMEHPIDLATQGINPCQDIFDNPADLPLTGGPCDMKPINIIWFSHGSWPFDPYHEENREECLASDLDGKEFLMIQSPCNILEIRTIEDLQDFVHKFCATKLTSATQRKIETLRNLRSNLRSNPFVVKLIDHEDDTVRYRDAFNFADRHGIERYAVTAGLREIAERESTALLESGSEGGYRRIDILEQFRLLFPDSQSLQYKDSSYFGANFNATMDLRRVVDIMMIKILEKIPDQMTQDVTRIDWDKVRSTGYWGVGFHFCKVLDIDPAVSFNDYYWHLSFDVESLCVWDVRAFVNSAVYPVTLWT
jgi:hypothetical protein